MRPYISFLFEDCGLGVLSLFQFARPFSSRPNGTTRKVLESLAGSASHYCVLLKTTTSGYLILLL